LALTPRIDVQRVLAEAHDDDAADRFAFAVQFRDAAPDIRPEPHLRDVAHTDRRPSRTRAERDAFDVR